MNPKISIIILNWNGANDTIECINSLKNIYYDNYNIIVVDNGSEEVDYLLLQQKTPATKIIRSGKNSGFTGGNNIGIRYALESKTDYLLLLNNDTIVEPDFIQPLLRVFVEEKKVGIVAPQINYYDDPQKVWTAGGTISYIRSSGFAYSDKTEDRISKNVKEVTFVSGCCMLIKTEAIEKSGLFDDNFFLYGEDVDLCYRTLKSGFRIFVAPKAKIYHKVSSSTSKALKTLPLYYVTRNRLYLSKKHFNKAFLLTFLYLVVTMFLKSIVWLLQGKVKNVRAIIKAFTDFFSGKMGKQL